MLLDRYLLVIIEPKHIFKVGKFVQPKYFFFLNTGKSFCFAFTQILSLKVILRSHEEENLEYKWLFKCRNSVTIYIIYTNCSELYFSFYSDRLLCAWLHVIVSFAFGCFDLFFFFFRLLNFLFLQHKQSIYCTRFY